MNVVSIAIFCRSAVSKRPLYASLARKQQLESKHETISHDMSKMASCSLVILTGLVSSNALRKDE